MPSYFCKHCSIYGVVKFCIFAAIVFSVNKMDVQNIENCIREEKAVLLYFFTDSCAACKSLRPKVEALMQSEFPKMQMLFLRSDENRDLCLDLGVYANPTLIVFFEGKEYVRWSQYVSAYQMQKDLSRLYAMVFEDASI